MPSSDPTEIPGPELLARAGRHGGRTALITPEGRFTYRQLLTASEGVARRLLGGRPDLDGSRVAFLAAPGPRWAALQWGAWRAGGVAVPLALAQPARELAYVLADCGAATVVADAALAGPLRAVAAELDLPLLTSAAIVRPWEAGLEHPAGEGIDEEAGRALRAASGAPPGSAEPPPTGTGPLPRVLPAQGAMILYTSGTTGRPKGVLTTHANLEAQVRSLVEAWGWRPDDHVHGIVNVLTCALWSGARCSVLAPFDAAATWERLAEGDLTLLMAVPTLYRRLLAAWDAADPPTRERWRAGARRLRLAVSGSAALPVRVLERWEALTGQRLLERYGMTEIGMALSNPLDGERRPGHVGAPLPGVEVRLADERGLPAPDGTPGEIEVRGPTVFHEYWGRPEETRDAFTPDGWFRTGDVAVRQDGSYRILGRTSVDIVKTGGEKVSALEVEEALREHPALGDCAVVGVADPEWGERLCVAVVLEAGASEEGVARAVRNALAQAGEPDEAGESEEAGEPPEDGEPREGVAPPLTLETLRAWARERLAPWKIPRALAVVDALPRNAMGKVDKPAVRKLFRA